MKVSFDHIKEMVNWDDNKSVEKFFFYLNDKANANYRRIGHHAKVVRNSDLINHPTSFVRIYNTLRHEAIIVDYNQSWDVLTKGNKRLPQSEYTKIKNATNAELVKTFPILAKLSKQQLRNK